MEKTKKAQEEMVGFMVIVVLIVVAGLLVLMLQKPQQNTDFRNEQVNNLLYSIISYTSSYQNKPLGEVIGECDICAEEPCEPCEIAESEIDGIMKVSQEQGGFVAGEQINGYVFNVSGYKELIVRNGELKGDKIGSFAVIQSGKDIIVTLSFYY